jgi:hypothetical protein
LTRTTYIEDVRNQVYNIARAASMCLVRLSQQSNELKRNLQKAFSTAFQILGPWFRRQTQIIGLFGLFLGSRYVLSSISKQELQRTLRESKAETEEIEHELTTAVYWTDRAGEILEACEGLKDHAPSEDHQAVLPSNLYALESLREENLRLTVLTKQLEGELTRTRSLQADFEHQIRDFNEEDNTKHPDVDEQ